MTLTAGSIIGPYSIDREIGRGGMGVVYLGHDTRLDRPVAIKALPEQLAEDPDRLARFEREAKTLAQLSHPNVAGIHGVEEHDGARYLVLEYVEGETLAERLDHGPLSPDEAIEIAAQIAAGVEAAHDAGVVHRDLKPGNVIVTPDGRAKVLDFGLARSDEAHSSSGSVSQAPTLTSPAMHSPTVPGVILGTAAYMSPEQARGRRVDKRTDVWSFGVMLYEMLCGASPFVGETVSDSIGAVLHKDLDLDRLPPATPANVRRVITRCVQRDRNERYRDIGDARLDLLQKEAAQAIGPSRRNLAPLLALAPVLAIVAGTAAWLLKPAPPAPTPPTLHMAVPISTSSVDFGFWDRWIFDVHPSGMQIAYIGVDPNDESDSPVRGIYVRDLDAPAPRMLEGTQHAQRLSYSPDGTQIAYVWYSPDAPQPEMRRISAEGGASVRLFTDPPLYRLAYPPCWIDDARLAYIGDDFTTIDIGSAAGGLPEPLINLAEASPGYLFTHDIWSPPSGNVLYISGANAVRGPEVYELDLETKEIRTVLTGASYFRLINDRTAFFRFRDVYSVAAWDPSARAIMGEIIPVMAEFSRGDVAFEMTPTGAVVYEARPTANVSRVMSIDRSGRVEPVSEARRVFAAHMSVSPDGEQLALFLNEGADSAWALDIESGYLRAASPEGGLFGVPTWLPDGRYTYSDFTDSLANVDVIVADLNAVDSGQPLLTDIGWSYELSADGSLAFATQANPDNSDTDIFLIDMATGDRTPLLATSNGEGDPTPSPDGRLLAYITYAVGGSRVAVRTFDAPTRTLSTRPIPVSSRGAKGVFWSADGTELFWWNTESRALMAADVRYEPVADGDAPTVQISEERVVFTANQMPAHINWPPQPVDISPDGERFYFIEARESDEIPTYLNVVLNWGAELERLLPDAP